MRFTDTNRRNYRFDQWAPKAHMKNQTEEPTRGRGTGGNMRTVMGIPDLERENFEDAVKKNARPVLVLFGDG